MASKNRPDYSAMALVGQLGFTIGVPVFLGIALGRFIDQKLETSPLFLVILLLLGLAAGLTTAYRQINTTMGGQGKGRKP